MPACTGQVAFHARVAANVLGIVARELELGAIPPEATLADNVAARLAVANPNYFDPAPPPYPAASVTGPNPARLGAVPYQRPQCTTSSKGRRLGQDRQAVAAGATACPRPYRDISS